MARSEDGIRLIKNAVFPELVPLLDGTRSELQIVKALSGKLAPARVRRAIALLEADGLAGPAINREPGTAAFWELASAGTTIKATASAEAKDLGLIEGLRAFGVRIKAGAPFRIVVARDYLDPKLREENLKALQGNRPWMLVRPWGARQWIGPLFRPGHTACWLCMARALASNGWSADGVKANLASAAAVTRAIAATEAAKFLLTGRNQQIEGRICAIDGVRLGITYHAVTRRPDCPACGPSRWTPRSYTLVPGLISPLTGIVTEPVFLRQEPGFHACAATGTTCIREEGGTERYSAPILAAGRGATEAEARASCIGEAIERYSTRRHGNEPLRRAPFAELRGEAVHPRDILLFSELQYRRQPASHFVPQPLPDAEPTDWAAAVCVLTGKRVWVPAAGCYYGCESPYGCADSNGCASASTVTEAATSGLLELIERDAVALWWYNRARRPRILPGANVGRIGMVLQNLERKGIRASLLDLTTDFRVPVCAAILRRQGTRVIGAGAAADMETAAWKALTEAYSQIDRRKPRAWRNAPWDPRPSAETRGLGEYESAALPFFQLARRVKRSGYRVLVVDLSRGETGAYTVRVIVPGLRHVLPRFAPGRLYQVPVALGWQKRELTEQQLNPEPFRW